MDDETRKNVRDGLRQGLQAKLAKIFDNLSSAGEKDQEQRFREGLRRAVVAYERALEILTDYDED